MSDQSACRYGTADRKIPAFVIDNFLRRLFREPMKFVSKYLSSGDTAADLGCGPGYFSLPMAKVVGESGRVHAVDFDEKAIRHLEQKAAHLECGRTITARAASASEIDFIASNSVDFVLADGLLCCMKDHTGAVEQIKRILRTEGKAYLSVVKFSKTGDPRGVSQDEWKSLLADFRLLDSGESLISRWAFVSLH